MIKRILCIAVAAGLLLAACSNPFAIDADRVARAELRQGWGQVHISLDTGAARMLLPGESLSIASYKLLFSADGKADRSHTVNASGESSLQLPVGQWNLAVSGRNAADFPLLSGTSSVDVQSGGTAAKVNVDLYPIEGEGSLELLVDVTALDDGRSVTDGFSISGYLAYPQSDEQIELAFVADETGLTDTKAASFVLERNDVPHGYYTLFLSLIGEDGAELAPGMETVMIAAGSTTSGQLSFSEFAPGKWYMGGSIGTKPGDEIDPIDPYDGIRVYVQNFTHIHSFNVVPAQPDTDWPGVELNEHSTGWMYYEFPNVDALEVVFSNNGGGQTDDLTTDSGTNGNRWFHNGSWHDEDPLGPTEPIVITDPAGGRFNSAQNVQLISSNPDDVIYYTLNTSTPTTSSSVYSGAIELTQPTTVRAFGINRDGEIGDVYDFEFDIDYSYDMTPPEISASYPGGSYADPIAVSFSVTDNEGGSTQAYYTTENRPATDQDTVYVEGDASVSGGLQGSSFSIQERTRFNFLVVDASGNEISKSFFYNIGIPERNDFREETIYFLMTTRFYDGDPSNNVFAWDNARTGGEHPEWRGDFKGLVEKLDYIKALGFSAVWITPVVKNMSGYDYHGYHSSNHSEVDPRYKSPGYDYQRLIDEFHARDMKIIQDVVWNHTGNFGDEVLHPLFEMDSDGYQDWQEPDNHIANDLLNAGAEAIAGAGATYASLQPDDQFQARIRALRDPLDTEHIYHHHEFKGGWEQYEVQIGSLAGDCQDLNTENPVVTDYLIDAYNRYIDMGVDAFRIDTVKHMSRLVLNREFLPAFHERGGEHFFMFGEVATRYRSIWNDNNPNISTPFYTWKGANDDSYPWATREEREASVYQYWQDNGNVGDQPSSDNHVLENNTYREPDYSMFSGQAVIDFPMHWSFNTVSDAWNIAVGGDWAYNDATWNVTYVDGHDYAPDTAPENQRYAGFWPDKLSLMFTFRGIPTIYYGTEIEFMKGAVIDVGPNAPLDETGRAYFGDHIEGSVDVQGFGRYSNATGSMADTLNHDLARHIRALNLVRHAVPALQKGQYATDGFQAFRRRFTDNEVDSFALVVLDGDQTFNNVPNGTYRDVITGESHTVSGGSATLSAPGAGNVRVWVLYGGQNQDDPGHVLDGMFPLEWIN